MATETSSGLRQRRARAGAEVKRKLPASALLQIGASQWTVVLALIFGGCCSNVFTLEAIVNEDPDAGNLITFVQFLFVAAEGYIHFFTPSRPPLFLPKPSVPIVRYVFIVSSFFLVSLLNNYVWKYHISVPVHIIFRSGGTVITLVVGAVAGKRYSKVQVASVVLLTVGVVTATLFDAKKETTETVQDLNKDFLVGILILFLAQTLSAVMSQLTESTYRRYGNHWRENLFYMHFLTLPFFAPVWRSVVDEYKKLSMSKLVPLVPSALSAFVPQIHVPQNLVYLFLNAATQYMCVRGVNNLAGSSTAVTVTIVLNVRKCVSLLLSIYIFGNKLSLGTCFGAALVFGSAAWYSIESSRLRQAQRKRDE